MPVAFADPAESAKHSGEVDALLSAWCRERSRLEAMNFLGGAAAVDAAGSQCGGVPALTANAERLSGDDGADPMAPMSPDSSPPSSIESLP